MTGGEAEAGIEEVGIRPVEADGRGSCFEAMRGDRVLGRVGVDLACGELVALEVAEAHRREGVGTQLLALAERLVQDKGLTEVLVDAPRASHGFFQKRGYRPDGDGRLRKRVEGNKTFDRAAAQYHAARPGYPEEMIEAVLSASGLEAGGSILEVGSGTGKATLPFARRGFAITCIEPGKNLAAIARRECADLPGVRFEATTFEEWSLEKGRFGLVVSGQAFHWVDQESGYRKAGEALRDGGALALFWNHTASTYDGAEPEIGRAIDEVYARHAPQLGRRLPASLRRMGNDVTLERIRRAGCFDDPVERSFPWRATYTAAQYAQLLSTHSDHALLWDETREALLADVARVIGEAGGALEIRYETVLFLAKRNG